MDPLDCRGCTQCCRFISFGVDMSNLDQSDLAQKLDYHTKRGCKIVNVESRKFVIIVPSKCTYLTADGCSIWDTIKPAICRRYDCRNDPYLPKGGNYNP